MSEPDPAGDDVLDAAAYLLDVDGTLVDSNYLHVLAWQQAVRDVGRDAPASVIHRACGLDSEKLLDEIAPGAPESQREQLVRLHAAHYDELAPQLRRLPGARELLRELHERGVRVVLATSAPQNEVDHLLPVLDSDEYIDEITMGEDVETAKPEPDVFELAVDRAGFHASRCLVVGDARWDMIAAGRAHVTAIGVESGGTDRKALLDAGAVAVYRDPQDILDRLRRRS